jgi:hypothetical protein
MKRPLLGAAVVGLIAIVPMYVSNIIICILPLGILLVVGAAAAFISISMAKPETVSKGTELGAIAALIGGGVALSGLCLSQFRISLIIDYTYPLDIPNAGFFEMFQFAIQNEPLQLIRTGLSILIMALFLITFAVAAGAIAGYNRSRALLSPSHEDIVS